MRWIFSNKIKQRLIIIIKKIRAHIQFPLGFKESLLICRIDQENNCVNFGEIISPDSSRLLVSSEIKGFEPDVSHHELLHVCRKQWKQILYNKNQKLSLSPAAVAVKVAAAYLDGLLVGIDRVYRLLTCEAGWFFPHCRGRGKEFSPSCGKDLIKKKKKDIFDFKLRKKKIVF